MIVDGRAIAADIYREISETVKSKKSVPLHLTVFTCSPNFETQKYLELKKRKANEVGISVNVVEFPHDITTDEIVQSIVNDSKQTDGVIVQLPLPEHIDADEVLRHISPTKDVDVIHYQGGASKVLPPVIGAIKEIADRNDIDMRGQKVVIVGAGKLVGKPAAIWATDQGAEISIITKETSEAEDLTKQADIIITGAGDPGFITPEKIKDGVTIFDAGTSEEGGILRGDVDPSCADKAKLFTPVPGGIGPITVAVLLRNLLLLND